MTRITIGNEVIDPVLEMRFEGNEVHIFNGYNWYTYLTEWLNNSIFEIVTEL